MPDNNRLGRLQGYDQQWRDRLHGSWFLGSCSDAGAGDNADDIGYMPFPITVDGKQYASAGPDYCYGINVHSDYDNQLASMIYVSG